MKQPLAGVAGLFAVGILIGAECSAPVVWLSALAVLAGLATLMVSRAASPALVLLLPLAGWIDFQVSLRSCSPDDLRLRFDSADHLVVVRGTLVAAPEERWQERQGRLRTNTLAVLAVHAVGSTVEDLAPASGRVLITTPAALGVSFPRGSRIEVSGILRPPAGPAAPGLFDYRSYLRWQGIHFEVRAPEPGDWKWEPGQGAPPPAWEERFQTWARRVLSRGLPGVDREVELLWAMTLGWKAGMTEEMQEPFLRSGTMHIFAISGLHIVLIAGIAGALLRFLLLPRLLVGLLVIPLCWGYTAATGWQASAIRATLMTTFVTGSWMLERPLNVLNSLAAAACVVLAWDPAQLFLPGFQLSFAVVGAIALIAPPLGAWLVALGDVDPFLPADRIPWWRQKVSRLWRGISLNLAVSFAAWLGSLPLSAVYFHLVTPGSLLANLAVVPLSSLALGCNLGSLVCGDWAPTVGELFNHSAWLWMHLTLAIGRGCAGLRGGWWYTVAPPRAWIALWYLGLWVVGRGVWRNHRWRGNLAGSAVMLTLALAGGWEWWAAGRETRLVLLSLHGGHAIWFAGPSGRSLVDCGDAPAVERVTTPFLHAEGVNQLPQLILTHGDVRHVGGARELASNLSPAQVVIGPNPFRSTAYRTVVDGLRERPGSVGSRSWVSVQRGETVGPWRVLHPAAGDAFSRADDGCLVLVAEPLPGHRVLLLGDLGRSGQEALLQREADLSAEVVVTGLPAVGEPLSDGLLDRIQPSLIVVADALQPATARAKPPLRARLRSRSAKVVFTSETGSLDLRCSGQGWSLRDSEGTPVVGLPQFFTNPGSLPVTR